MQVDIAASSTSPSKPKTCCPNSTTTKIVELKKNTRKKKSNLRRYNDMLHVCDYKLSSKVIPVPTVRSRTREN
jgi:hypothetical protein